MRLLKMGLALLPLFLLVPAVLAGDAGNVVLDQYDSWRMFSVLKPPEIALDDGVKVAEYKYNDNYWLNGETSQPPAGWTQPEFDDAQWLEARSEWSAVPHLYRGCAFEGSSLPWTRPR